jgi:hypothetical protein
VGQVKAAAVEGDMKSATSCAAKADEVLAQVLEAEKELALVNVA